MKKILFLVGLVLSGMVQAQTVTRLSCNLSGTLTYPSGKKEPVQGQLQLSIKTFPSGVTMFEGQSPEISINTATESYGARQVQNLSTPQLWYIVDNIIFEGGSAETTLRIDRVTGHLFQSVIMKTGTQTVTGTCSKIETSGKNKF